MRGAWRFWIWINVLTGSIGCSLLGIWFWFDSRAPELLPAIPAALIAWALRPRDWLAKTKDLFS